MQTGGPGPQEDNFAGALWGVEKTVGLFMKDRRNARRGQERVCTGRGSVYSAGKCLAWPNYCVEALDLAGASLFCSGR